MNKNVLIVLGGGFVIAMLVAMIVQAGLKGGETTKAQILVASRAVAVGKPLLAADVAWQAWPDDAVSSAMIVRKDSKQKVDDVAKGQQVRRDLSKGEPVLTSVLVSEGKGNVLAAALKPGYRAVAIKVKAESMVGGFISPGDNVDVIMTYVVNLGSQNKKNPALAQKIQKYAAETLLENVRVLAIDQQARKEDDKAKVGRTVTLEVDDVGAERLNLAGTMGELSLSLRSIGDTTERKSHGLTTDAQVSSVLREVNKIVSTSSQDNSGQDGSKPPANTVRVYNGESVLNITVRKDEAGGQP